jgi:hypothetical protein
VLTSHIWRDAGGGNHDSVEVSGTDVHATSSRALWQLPTDATEAWITVDLQNGGKTLKVPLAAPPATP